MIVESGEDGDKAHLVALSLSCSKNPLKKSQSEKFACYNSSDNVWTLKLPLAFIDSSCNLAFRPILALLLKDICIWLADVSLCLYLCIFFLSCILIVKCYHCNLVSSQRQLAKQVWFLSPLQRYFDIVRRPTAAEVTRGCGKNMWWPCSKMCFQSKGPMDLSAALWLDTTSCPCTRVTLPLLKVVPHHSLANLGLQ